MTHEDEGHYAGKHPAGTIVGSALADAVRGKTREGRISCAAAHAIAARLNLPPKEVGTAIDLQEARITRCQLGLFGYGKGVKKVAAPHRVDEALAAALTDVARDGEVTCRSCWRVAENLGRPRLEAACGCQGLGIKIRQCQLGAF